MSRAIKRKRTLQLRNRINSKNITKKQKDKVRRKVATVIRYTKILKFRENLKKKYEEYITKLYEDKTKDNG